MEVKKNLQADVSKKATSFFLIGLLITQLVVLAAFSYTWYEKEVEVKVTYNPEDDEVIEMTEITEQSFYVPPPPPPASIELVDDDELADDDVEIQDTEFDDQTVIDKPYEFSDYIPGGNEGDPLPTKVVEQEIFEVVEIMPEFPGGMAAMQKFMLKNFRYPDEAKRFDIEGRVMITFIVDEKGNITDVKPLLPENRRLGYGMEKEAMRVVEMMPKWNPGYQRNKAVRVRYTLPFNLHLN